MTESLSDTYEGIHSLPIYNWSQCVKGELRFLYKQVPSVNPEGSKLRTLIKAWEVMYNEYFKAYGMTDKLQEYIDNSRRLASLRTNCVVNDKRSLLTDIEILEHDLEQKPTRKTDLMETVVTLEKYIGFAIDVNVCSVAKYNSYIQRFNKAA